MSRLSSLFVILTLFTLLTSAAMVLGPIVFIVSTSKYFPRQQRPLELLGPVLPRLYLINTSSAMLCFPSPAAGTCSRNILAAQQPASFSRHQSCRHPEHLQHQSPASSILTSHLPPRHYQMLPRGGGWSWPGHGDYQQFNLLVCREVKQEGDGNWR